MKMESMWIFLCITLTILSTSCGKSQKNQTNKSDNTTNTALTDTISQSMKESINQTKCQRPFLLYESNTKEISVDEVLAQQGLYQITEMETYFFSQLKDDKGAIDRRAIQVNTAVSNIDGILDPDSKVKIACLDKQSDTLEMTFNFSTPLEIESQSGMVPALAKLSSSNIFYGSSATKDKIELKYPNEKDIHSIRDHKGSSINNDNDGSHVEMRYLRRNDGALELRIQLTREKNDNMLLLLTRSVYSFKAGDSLRNTVPNASFFKEVKDFANKYLPLLFTDAINRFATRISIRHDGRQVFDLFKKAYEYANSNINLSRADCMYFASAISLSADGANIFEKLKNLYEHANNNLGQPRYDAYNNSIKTLGLKVRRD